MLAHGTGKRESLAPAQASHDVALKALQHPQVAGERPRSQPERLVHKDVMEVDG